MRAMPIRPAPVSRPRGAGSSGQGRKSRSRPAAERRASRTTARRLLATGLAGALSATLSACVVLPPALPSASSPGPLEPVREDVLAASLERCGAVFEPPAGDASFVGVVEIEDASGPALELAITVTGGSSHGEHGIGGADGALIDAGGAVAGVVTASSWADTGELSGIATLEFASCPEDGGATPVALADGDYLLSLSGHVSPLDHEHAQAEYWVADAFEVTVEGGAFQH